MKPRRESRYIRVARLAHELAKAVVPRYSHVNSPQWYTQPQLVACVILKAYLGLSYRDTEEWLLAADGVCQVLGLDAVPDHSTLSRVVKRLGVKLARQMNRLLLRQLSVEEAAIALDGTGFSVTQASSYYLTRKGDWRLEYVKGLIGVGTHSQLILDWLYAPGRGNEMAYVNRLRRGVQGYGRRVKRRPRWDLLADKGFDGEQARPTDLIPPRHPIIRPDRVQRAHGVERARAQRLLGQRWKCETVFSVIKRLSGASLTSRSPLRQRREMGFKFLAYNLHR
jgi:IS5 family transposase